jgi:hypothetical protein
MHPPTQLSRCFIQPIEEPPENKGGGRGGPKRRTWRDEIPPGILEALSPWAHPELILDVETTTDAQSCQRAKVGFWQNRRLKYEDRCNLYAQGKLSPETMDQKWREGVFYNKLTCTASDIQTIKDYAAKHGLWCMEMADFICNVFYRQAKLNAYIPDRK